jgi:hypothetical protein
LNAFLLCDQVLRDQHGRPSLIGLFQHLRSPVFPLPPRNFSVFFSLSEVVVPSQLKLSFRDSAWAKLVKEVAIDCTTKVAPDQAYEINVDFDHVVFEHPGAYDFELRADGQVLALRSLTLSKA